MRKRRLRRRKRMSLKLSFAINPRDPGTVRSSSSCTKLLLFPSPQIQYQVRVGGQPKMYLPVLPNKPPNGSSRSCCCHYQQYYHCLKEYYYLPFPHSKGLVVISFATPVQSSTQCPHEDLFRCCDTLFMRRSS